MISCFRNTMTDHPLRKLWQLLYSLYFYAVFFAISAFFYWYGCVTDFRTKDSWRLLALRALDIIFFCTHLRIHITGLEQIPEEPVLFAANHQSFLDGLILFYVLRRPFNAITAPPAIFPGNLPSWFKKMGYISIGRDLFEELKYKDARARNQSIPLGVAALKRGESLLIFPEGRREYQRHLLPFHGGVAKIAHDARVAIMPVVIEGLDTLFPYGSVLLTPTILKVKIEKPVRLHEPNTNIVREVIELEEVMRRDLPARYFAPTSLPHAPQGRRAAFFDLDGTISRANIYQAIIFHYFRTHLSWHAFVLLIRLGLSRMTKAHGYFYKDAVRLLKGIRRDEMLAYVPGLLKRDQKALFYEQMLKLLALHRKEGNLIFIISEEPDELLQPVLDFLGVEGYGTSTQHEGQTFTGILAGPIMKDEEKRELVLALAHKHGIDLSKSFAYGNSWHDYAMLRSIGHAALVNPEKKLHKRGRKLGWKIIRER